MKKNISRRKVEEFLSNDYDFRAELALSYQDMGYDSVIYGHSYHFYEYASFLVEDNGVTIQHRLHVGETLSIMTEDNGSFAILRSIFSHKKGDHYFAFIIVDWFEITNQTKLECPIYRL